MEIRRRAGFVLDTGEALSLYLARLGACNARAGAVHTVPPEGGRAAKAGTPLGRTG